jgi:hypothetical protein
VVLEAEGSIHSVAENALDVPHTVYLHGGLFRSAGGPPNDIEVVVRRKGDMVEAEYFGEPRPAGIAGRLLAPGGGKVRHVDRFILPSITQVDYRMGDSTHMSVTVVMTPMEDYLVRLFAVVSFRLPVPGWLAAPVLKPLFLRIFNQDVVMLRAQTGVIRHFGGEQFASTEADTLGPYIHRMLKMAEAGERSADQREVEVKRSRLRL